MARSGDLGGMRLRIHDQQEVLSREAMHGCHYSLQLVRLKFARCSRKWASVALTDKGPPKIRVGIPFLYGELCMSQGVGSWFASQDALVERHHQLACLFIWHFPKTHDQRLCTGEDKRPP